MAKKLFAVLIGNGDGVRAPFSRDGDEILLHGECTCPDPDHFSTMIKHYDFTTMAPVVCPVAFRGIRVMYLSAELCDMHALQCDPLRDLTKAPAVHELNDEFVAYISEIAKLYDTEAEAHLKINDMNEVDYIRTMEDVAKRFVEINRRVRSFCALFELPGTYISPRRESAMDVDAIRTHPRMNFSAHTVVDQNDEIYAGRTTDSD